MMIRSSWRTCKEGAFGDFIAKVDGLPPLSEIENIRREKSSKNLQELRQNSRFDRRLPNQNMEILWNQENKM
ncbi:BnaA06g19190D [Brassica napus]|uniref:BnaA06g19190D protein n=1 Tax=Brassica napus TaxID=3708 RepID=A0A078HM17_BRANA|nr:BnaA06g19190D [Brassica napus]